MKQNLSYKLNNKYITSSENILKYTKNKYTGYNKGVFIFNNKINKIGDFAFAFNGKIRKNNIGNDIQDLLNNKILELEDNTNRLLYNNTLTNINNVRKLGNTTDIYLPLSSKDNINISSTAFFGMFIDKIYLDQLLDCKL